jgi:RNA polymerase sigma-70 factor (ECF subfamily)
MAAVETPPVDLSPERILHDYAPRVYAVARRMLNNDADAEDVTQDVLMRMLRKHHTFRGESAFPTWLHRVTVNAALAYRQQRARREQRRADASLADLPPEEAHPGPGRRWVVPPEQEALDHETQRLIEEAIAGLPETYRDIYVLADVRMRRALAPYFEEKTP